MSGDRRPLDVPADEVAGTLAARRELGTDAEDAVIANFLDRAGDAIDRRVDQRLGHQPGHQQPVYLPAAPPPRPDDEREARKDARTLAIWSIVLALPITGAATGFDDAGPVVAVASWVGIGAINFIFNRRHRR